MRSSPVCGVSNRLCIGLSDVLVRRSIRFRFNMSTFSAISLSNYQNNYFAPVIRTRNRGSGNTVAVLLGNGAGVGRRACYLCVPCVPSYGRVYAVLTGYGSTTHCDSRLIVFVFVCARARFSIVSGLARRRRRCRHHHRLEKITTVSPPPPPPPPYTVRIPPSASWTQYFAPVVTCARGVSFNRRRVGNDDVLRSFSKTTHIQ